MFVPKPLGSICESCYSVKLELAKDFGEDRTAEESMASGVLKKLENYSLVHVSELWVKLCTRKKGSPGFFNIGLL